MRGFQLTCLFWILLLAAPVFLPGCREDACVWSTTQAVGDRSATLQRDGTALSLDPAETYAGIASMKFERSGELRSELVLVLTVKQEPVVDQLLIEVEVDPSQVPALIRIETALGLGRASLTLQGSGTPEEVVGAVKFDRLEVTCEHSDAYSASSGGWDCATNADATIEVSFLAGEARYQISATLSQREVLSLTCHECDGIEGCNY